MDQNKDSVTKINIGEKSFYVRVIWKLNETDIFDMKLYDGDNTWSGRFSYESSIKPRKICDETEEEYCDNVKKCFNGNKDYIFSFIISPANNESATFSWKKKFEDGAKLLHGSIALQVDNTTESKDKLLDKLIKENDELKTIISNLTQKNEITVAELDKCKSKLQEFADIKTSLETSLYGKFLQLLNAKKKRIQILEETLQMYCDNKEDT